MRAPPIRIDRLLKGNIGRIVGADDRARTLGLERRGNAVGCVLEVPAVSHSLEPVKVEGAGRIGEGAPACERLAAGDRAAHGGTVYIYRSHVKSPAAVEKNAAATGT